MGEGGREGPEVNLCCLHRRSSCLLRAAVACDALASRRAVSLNGLPGCIRISRPARAARTVKQRGAVVDALKAHKHAGPCVHESERAYEIEHEHERIGPCRCAPKYGENDHGCVRRMLDECDGVIATH